MPERLTSERALRILLDTMHLPVNVVAVHREANRSPGLVSGISTDTGRLVYTRRPTVRSVRRSCQKTVAAKNTRSATYVLRFSDAIAALHMFTPSFRLIRLTDLSRVCWRKDRDTVRRERTAHLLHLRAHNCLPCNLPASNAWSEFISAHDTRTSCQCCDVLGGA